MGIRVTVVLDSSNVKKLRVIQAKLHRGSTKYVSFSYVLNRVVKNGFLKF